MGKLEGYNIVTTTRCVTPVNARVVVFHGCESTSITYYILHTIWEIGCHLAPCADKMNTPTFEI